MATSNPASANERVDVAVIGLGWWGKVIVKTLKESGKLKVAKVVDPNPATAEWAEAQGLDHSTDLDAALADPSVSAVILCTPHSLHTEQVVRAANAKKHVFCEKPLALTLAEAQTSVGTCRTKGVVLGLGHELRFTPPMAELRRMIAAGDLGTLVQSEGTFSGLVNHASGNWRLSTIEAPGGPPMTARGIHTLDLAISVHGPAERVFASLRKFSGQALQGDTLGFLVTFKSGANALIGALWSSPFANRYAVFGTNGWAEIRDKAHPEKAAGWTLTTCTRDEVVKSYQYEPMSPVLANLDAFADAIAGRATYPITPREMLAGIAALEAIGKSATGGALVDVAPVD
jgi:predicted dehydrogenase